jgi:hypothetical protein
VELLQQEELADLKTGGELVSRDVVADRSGDGGDAVRGIERAPAPVPAPANAPAIASAELRSAAKFWVVAVVVMVGVWGGGVGAAAQPVAG